MKSTLCLCRAPSVQTPVPLALIILTAGSHHHPQLYHHFQAIIINHCTLFAENSLLCVAIDIISALHVVLKTHPENVVTVTMELIATMSMDSAIVSRDIKGRR